MENHAVKILVIEDEEDIRTLLLHLLRKDGYAVFGAADGETGLEMAAAQRPGAVVLDLMLPGMDGVAVCRRLRADPHLARTPILMLTARTEEADLVSGLDAGADDYVSKPFSNRVLLARIRSLLRRSGVVFTGEDAEDDALVVGDIRLVPERMEVRVGGAVVDLTAGEFKMLRALMRRPGIVFSRDQLLHHVHGAMHAVTDRAVDVQVVALRRKLGAAGGLIETVRGVGYRMRRSRGSGDCG